MDKTLEILKQGINRFEALVDEDLNNEEPIGDFKYFVYYPEPELDDVLGHLCNAYIIFNVMCEKVFNMVAESYGANFTVEYERLISADDEGDINTWYAGMTPDYEANHALIFKIKKA